MLINQLICDVIKKFEHVPKRKTLNPQLGVGLIWNFRMEERNILHFLLRWGATIAMPIALALDLVKNVLH